MKKTFTINLGGVVYHIDEDAYELFENYLNNLRIYFNKEKGGEEIVHDMELRISELFSEHLRDGKQVITIKDVEEIKSLMMQLVDCAPADRKEAFRKKIEKDFADPAKVLKSIEQQRANRR